MLTILMRPYWALRNARVTSTSQIAVTALAVLLTFVGAARATDYNDGGTHTISGADTNVSIFSGTTVNVAAGANITGSAENFPSTLAVPGIQNAGTLNVTGGTITGGPADGSAAPGVTGNGHFSFSGGIVYGGVASGAIYPNTGSAPAAVFNDYQSLTISAGDFYGGDLGDSPGNGADVFATSATAYISGGNFHGGSNLFGVADAMQIHGSPSVPVSAVISGGTFQNGLLHLIDAVVNFTDFQPDAANQIQLDGNSVANVSGGDYSNDAFSLYNNSSLNLTNGSLHGLTLYDDSTVDVSGGQLSSAVVLNDNAVMDLTGGQLTAGPEDIVLFGSSVLNVYGMGLSLQMAGGPYWELQGTLADGTPIGELTTVLIFENSMVNLIEVPEPSTCALGILGVVALMLIGRVESVRKRGSTCH